VGHRDGGIVVGKHALFQIIHFFGLDHAQHQRLGLLIAVADLQPAVPGQGQRCQHSDAGKNGEHIKKGGFKLFLMAQHLSAGYEPSSPYAYVGAMWIRAAGGKYYPKYPAGLPLSLRR